MDQVRPRRSGRRSRELVVPVGTRGRHRADPRRRSGSRLGARWSLAPGSRHDRTARALLIELEVVAHDVFGLVVEVDRAALAEVTRPSAPSGSDEGRRRRGSMKEPPRRFDGAACRGRRRSGAPRSSGRSGDFPGPAAGCGVEPACRAGRELAQCTLIGRLDCQLEA